MDRRDFLKKSATGVSAVAVAGLVGLPAMAAATRRMTHNKSDMKKIMIIDGGPRRNMNTAGMLRALPKGRNRPERRSKSRQCACTNWIIKAACPAWLAR